MPEPTSSIPWPNVIRFHMEIVGRGEESFFSFSQREPASQRYAWANETMMTTLAGPWVHHSQEDDHQPFWNAIDRGAHETVFLGGPCYRAPGREPIVRPLLYREVEINAIDGRYEIAPKQGKWALCPPVRALLDRAQLRLPERNEARFVHDLVDDAATRTNGGSTPLAAAVWETLRARTPELAGIVRASDGPGSRSAWILFAPENAEGVHFNRHLMTDYRRIEANLARSADRTGGLTILEGGYTRRTGPSPGVQPLVPLNDRQRAVVEAVIGGAPLTVVTGPPGCGKSQVVLSILLNAWARGQSVLFVSSNNNAVDVVYERLRALGSNVPIAIRAGGKTKSNAIGVLNDLLAAVADWRGRSHPAPPAGHDAERESLIKRLEALHARQDSKIPHKIAEQARSALTAFGNQQETMLRVRSETERLEAAWRSMGFHTYPSLEGMLGAGETVIDAGRGWADRQSAFETEQQSNADRRAHLARAQAQAAKRRDDELARIDVRDTNTVHGLMSRGSPNALSAWHAKLERIVGFAATDILVAHPWDLQADRWSSARHAEQASRDLAALADRINDRYSEVAEQIEAVTRHAMARTKALAELRTAGMDEPPRIGPESIDEWHKAFRATLTTTQNRWNRVLQACRLSPAQRTLTRIERDLTNQLPTATCRQIGPFDQPGGRDRLSDVLDQIRRHRNASDAGAKAEAKIEDAFAALRREAANLGVKEPREELESARHLSRKAWSDLANQAHAGSREAATAATAWTRRAEHDDARAALQHWLGQWQELGRPVHDALVEMSGGALPDALAALRTNPSTGALQALDTAARRCDVTGLVHAWRAALAHHEDATGLEQERGSAPLPDAPLRAWWAEAPRELATILANLPADRFPDPETLAERLKALRDLLEETRRFLDEDRVAWTRAAAEERRRADAELRNAAALVDVSEPGAARLHELCTNTTESTGRWPTEALRAAFYPFEIGALAARIEATERELAERTVRATHHARLENLTGDDEACDAASKLKAVLASSNGVLPNDQHTVFSNALRAVPIWVTTAKSVQAIPTAPAIFDLVMVDEASQCTLSDLLPALYRGKHWAVIGDTDQLPAIPTVRKAEEDALSAKHELDPFLERVGHRDLFRICIEALPGREARIMHLIEHFRSHPQIIGFSNRYVYRQRLRLARSTLERAPLGVHSGLFSYKVPGNAERGDRGASWINRPEAERVVEGVRRLTTNDQLRGASIGVVTPFRGQKELIQRCLATERLPNAVMVDSAYGFQGDERDVMVFSPVVANGMTPGAQAFVQEPPNLINVALTRARHALYIVADLDFLLRQPLGSKLHELATYCRNIEILRETSPAELELYGWMVLQGWTPEVHPRIGNEEVDFKLDPPSRDTDTPPLVIEVDGHAYHREDSEADKARDAFLYADGYQVLRIRARDVFGTPFTVLEQIERRLQRDPNVPENER